MSFKIYGPQKRQYKCKSIPTTDWNEQTKAEEWWAAWAQLCNQALKQYGHAERLDYRSYEWQGIDQIATVHLADIYFRYKGKKPLTDAEQIRKNVYSILRQQQREWQPRI